jgi:hypothetical protein
MTDTPPSFDRNRFVRRKILVGSILAVAVTGAAVFVSLTFLRSPDDFGVVPKERSTPPQSNRAQLELASAFQAV